MKKITWRWLFNSFGVIVLIIVAIIVTFAVGITNYYYNSVRQTLKTQADLANTVFAQYYDEDSANFYSHMRDYIAGFSARERMELMAIDGNGAVLFTSSGFAPDNGTDLPDYQEALGSEEKEGRYIGTNGNQRVMAVSVVAVVDDPALSAVRMMVSLENVDRQIAFWIICIASLGIVILLLVLFSSSYFISSIVNPVGEVGQIARRIADGNFDVRLEKSYNDEIGDLCDTINYMAEKLGETERMKNDFISSVSHELRTPLTAIQGWGETLLSDGGQDKTILRKGMGIIINETGRLSHMVEELLDFSRMQSGRLTMDLAKTDVLAELSDVVLMYTERAKREGKELTYRDNDLFIPMMADKNKLRQVFVNIVDNAVKYSDPGDAVHVTADADGENLVIVVADTGIGIRPEDLPKVKTKFFKANTTRRSSGIGLAVADEIIAQHGGTLDIESAYEKGTRITITLPVKGLDDGKSNAAQKAQDAE